MSKGEAARKAIALVLCLIAGMGLDGGLDLLWVISLGVLALALVIVDRPLDH